MAFIKVAVYMMMMVLIAAGSDLHYFHNTQNNLSSTRMGFDMQPQLPTFLKKGHHFIVGGKYVKKIHKYPYMAFVYSEVPHLYRLFCGGTILSRKYVLTAGHCMSKCKRTLEDNPVTCIPIKLNSDDFTIYVGSAIPGNALEQVKVKAYFVHPNFIIMDDLNKCENNYDIAILELRTPLKFNNKISSVKLPNPLKTRQTMKNCKVLGWGNTQGEQKSRAYYPEALLIKLKVTSLQVISTKECLKHLQISNVNNSNQPDLGLCRDTQICAMDKKNKNGACFGDSGGPLICNGVQVGIMSGIVGYECVGPHLPTIYTRIDVNLQWINTITKV